MVRRTEMAKTAKKAKSTEFPKKFQNGQNGTGDQR